MADAPQGGDPTDTPAQPGGSPPPATYATVVSIQRSDDIAAVCGRIESAPTLAVIVHAKEGNLQLQTELGMRRLVRHGQETGKVVAIATHSRSLAGRARQLSVPVARSPGHVRWDSGGHRVARLGKASLRLPAVGWSGQVGLLLLILATALALALTLLPHATVRVEVPAEERTATVLVIGERGRNSADFTGPIARLPLTEVTAPRVVTLTSRTTGKAAVDARPAKVILTMANTGSSDVTVPEGSFLLAGSGADAIEFVLDLTTVVPAGKSVTQGATATRPGPRGNVPAGSITRWRSDTFVAVRVSNANPAGGGTAEDRPAVDAKDVQALKDLAKLLETAPQIAGFLAEERPNDAILGRSAKAAATVGEPSPAIGQPGEVVTVEVTLALSGFAFPRSAIEALARQALPGNGGTLVPGTVIAVETGAVQRDDENGNRWTELRLRASFSEEADAAAIRESVKGKSPGNARSTLRSRYGIEESSIDLTPGWAPWLPRFGSRIDVELQSETPTKTGVSSPTPNATVTTPASPTGAPTTTPTPRR